MAETPVNVRWLRDNRFMKRLTSCGAVIAAGLWPLSYVTSLSAASVGQGMWFTTVSLVTLVAAIAVSGWTIFGACHICTDEPPLPGSNHY